MSISLYTAQNEAVDFFVISDCRDVKCQIFHARIKSSLHLIKYCGRKTTTNFYPSAIV